MTQHAALTRRHTLSSGSDRSFSLSGSGPNAVGKRPAAPMATRSYEIAALREDGSLYIGQDKAPALPLFESAFSAFARGTLILTTQGEVAIEDLQPGDMIATSSGEPAQLIWVLSLIHI